MDDLEQSARNATSLVGTVVADRYRIDELLGEGAMGAVYRAEHIHMQKAVALKVLHRETSSNPEVVKRFEREAVAAGRVVHQNVASAQDFGQLEGGSFYLVLEYVAGRSLREVLEAGPLSAERTLAISEQVAAALAAAHAAGIVHRDLKPENVMLVGAAEGRDLVKVLDFGLAKLGQDDSTDTKLTKLGAVYGTPQYMAPEQASGSEVDHRADLYALGVMMYEMLCGEPPFQADQMVALLIKHMTEEPPPLPENVPPALAALVARLLAKNPDERPQSADELRLQLLGGTRPEDVVRLSLPSSPLLGASASPLPPEARASRAFEAQASRAAAWGAATGESTSAVARFTERARALFDRAVEFLRVPVSVRGRPIPRGLFVFGALALVLGVGLAWAPSSEEKGSSSSSTLPRSANKKEDASQSEGSVKSAPIDPELGRVLEAARQGSESALYALEQRKDEERSVQEWMALAQARLLRKNVPPALTAFGAAIEADETQAYDKTVLGVLRHLAEDERYARPILEFASEKLGQVGADFLFHVWARTSLKTPATTLAYELLTNGEAKHHRSPALAVALDLRDAKECEDYKVLLERVEEFGDDRSMVRLRELEKNRGCGEGGRSDCYPCLREGDALKKAISQAQLRAAPRFELPRRFRFR